MRKRRYEKHGRGREQAAFRGWRPLSPTARDGEPRGAPHRVKERQAPHRHVAVQKARVKAKTLSGQTDAAGYLDEEPARIGGRRHRGRA